MRIVRTALALCALVVLGSGLGGCTHTGEALAMAATAGVTRGMTHELMSEARYEQAGYRPWHRPPPGYCRWLDGGPGKLFYHPGSPNNLRCECWPPNRPKFVRRGGFSGGGYGYNPGNAYGFPGSRRVVIIRRPPFMMRPHWRHW